MISIEQCRAARGLLDWTQQDLADASGLSKTAINNFEKGHSDIKGESLRAIRMAFESADIEFLGDEGLRKKNDTVRIFKGSIAFSDLLDDIYETLKNSGGEVLISNIDESAAIGEGSPKKLLEHLERLEKHGITQRIIGPEGTASMLAAPENCRWLARAQIRTMMSSFIYGQKVALQLWDKTIILVINSADASRTERLRFEHIWDSAAVVTGETGAATRKG
ncbi:MAG: helix-turn-helix domain-containing protein [Alphaproteobacteria bacterium]|nr:helix-turn-helix domain-containing protein [Alphaproteobacteria bacterium]